MASRRLSEADRDALLRAVAGALFGALPLLFTMEMWWHGRVASEPLILLFLCLSVGIVALGLMFGGFRHGGHARLALDLPITFGVAIFVAAATLLIVGQIQPGSTPFSAAVRMVAVETIPCALGAALALTLLRPRQRAVEVDRGMDRLPQDQQKLLATIVGGSFFAFNIAPTEEPWKMTLEAEPIHFPLIVLFSLAVSYIVVFLADFAERPPHYREGALGTPLAETLVSYLVSLGVSYGFLLAFGHIGASTPLEVQIGATVMLGYVTTIGGSAGRVIVSE